MYGATDYRAKNKNINVRGCNLENTFTSIDHMSKLFLPGIFTSMNKFLITNNWNSIDRIEKLDIPALFIKSKKDELVPIAQMDELMNKAVKCPNKVEYVIVNGDHNSNWNLDAETYFKRIK